MKKVLSIAGSDCSGGAGIQADLKTFSAHGVFGMTAIVSVVAENTARVIDIMNVSAEMIGEQIDAVYEDIVPDAVKVGMLSAAPQMEAVAAKLIEHSSVNVVIDPVMFAKNGDPLMDFGSIDTLIEKILPLADVLTPNIPEAELISELKIASADDMEAAAMAIVDRYGCATLCKGGHMINDASDFLCCPDGTSQWFEGRRIDNPNTHGTGCTLSSAIAAGLAKGMELAEAVEAAKEYISGALAAMLDLGKGSGPLDHGYLLRR